MRVAAMANVYYKILHSRVTENYTEKLISGVQEDLRNSANLGSNSIYDTVEELSHKVIKNRHNDINDLLKYYLLEQIINSKQKGNTPILFSTPNKNIKRDRDNNYYRLKENNWILDENIITVSKNGEYTTRSIRTNNLYTVVTIYDKQDQVIEIQACKNNEPIRDSLQVVEMLGFKKELINKYKYAGFSGNSKDIVATVLNKFYSPQESGYYMDTHYRMYKWNQQKASFIRAFVAETTSPLLTDFEFINDKTVLRKEYTGT